MNEVDFKLDLRWSSQRKTHNHLHNFDFGFILNEICELKINGKARSECH